MKKEIKLIGISGKSQSGKDLTGQIIQYLYWCIDNGRLSFSTWKLFDPGSRNYHWQIHKFADALKDIVCILTGCTREQLEDEYFKKSRLGNAWSEGYSIGSLTTYRELLQLIGTDLFRNQLHENIWINALFNKYKPIGVDENGFVVSESGEVAVSESSEIEVKLKPHPMFEPKLYPNWIITDVRFPNEAKAIKDRGGIIIRLNRPIRHTKGIYGELTSETMNKVNERLTDEITHSKLAHPSETALDDYPFDYTIDNNGSIEELIEQVKQILHNEKII